MWHCRVGCWYYAWFRTSDIGVNAHIEGSWYTPSEMFVFVGCTCGYVFAGTKYVVALNKVDRMYGWVAHPDSPFRKSLEKQKDEPKMEFRDRSRETLLAFATQGHHIMSFFMISTWIRCDGIVGYNACMYWDVKDWSSDYIALVPTSAITGMNDFYLV